MDYQTIFFDFDGVLCTGRFYSTLLSEYPEVYDWIQENIFGDSELVKKWMRNQISSADVNGLIAKNTGINYEILTELYKNSILQMKLETELIDLINSLSKVERKIGIITDNMDVFTQIIAPVLNAKFNLIINSADYGILKKDDDGKLFDIALNALGDKIENSLMIDDSESTIKLYRQKGGHGIVYKNFAELKSFLQI